MIQKNRRKVNVKVVVSGLIVVFLTPFAAKFGGEALGFFSTPGEVKATNKRIYQDSIFTMKQLKDSCFIFRGIIKNQNDRISEIENKLLKHRIK